MREGLAFKPDADPDRHRAGRGAAAGALAHLARRGARRRLRHLERAAHLPRRRSDARGAGAGQRAASCSTSASRRPTSRWPPASPRTSTPLVVLTVGTDCNVGKMTAQLQLAEQLRARGMRTTLRGHRPDRHHDRGVGDLGRRGGVRLHRRRGGAAGARGEQGRRHRPGRGAGEHQSPRVLRRHAEPAPRLLPRRADPLPPGQPRVPRRLPRRPRGSRFRRSRITSAGTRTSGPPVHPTKVVGICLNTYDLDEAEARAACASARQRNRAPLHRSRCGSTRHRWSTPSWPPRTRLPR